MTELPLLDNDQRTAGYEASLRLRRAQADLKASLKAGAVDFGTAWFSDTARGMKVYQLLKAMPRMGPRRAASVMKLAGIPADRRVRGVGPVQFSKLLKYLNPAKPASKAWSDARAELAEAGLLDEQRLSAARESLNEEKPS